MKRRLAILTVVLIAILMTGGLAQANPGAIANGIGWLELNQNPSGSWGNTPSSKTTEFLSTATAIAAIDTSGLSNSPAYESSIAWLNSASADNTAYLAERITRMYTTPYISSGDIANIMSFDNGYAWGGHTGYDSSPLHTAYALKVLTLTDRDTQAILQSTLGFLNSSQNADGGWGFYKGDASSTFITAQVLVAITPYEGFSSVASMGIKAEAFLLSHQNADGGFGSSPSTVYETALSYMALVERKADATGLTDALNYLTTTQGADGSWDADAYSTALAVSALTRVNEQGEPTPPPVVEEPEFSNLRGQVLDAESGYPLAGVMISSSDDKGLTGFTDAEGRFEFTELGSGSYGFKAYYPGYYESFFTVNFERPQTMEFGELVLTKVDNTGALRGKVTEAGTGLPIAGALVEVTGVNNTSTYTALDGSYMISNLEAGVLSVKVSAEGHVSLAVSDVLESRMTLEFSPSLEIAVPGESVGTIKGIVVNLSCGSPMDGVKVTVAELPDFELVTTGDGVFRITGLEPGTYTVSLYYNNLMNEEATVTVEADSFVDLGKVPLNPFPPPYGDIEVILKDNETSLPVEGALVEVYNTETGVLNASALTGAEGIVLFDDMPLVQYDIKISAEGYKSRSSQLTLTEGAVYRQIFMMGKSAPVIIIDGVVTPVSTISGRVTAEYDGRPIEGALVSILSDLTAVTDADGQYIIEDVEWLNFSLSVTAEGYEAVTERLSYTESGSFTVDVALNEDFTGKIKLGQFTVDKPGYGPHEDVIVSGTVQYTGEMAAEVQIVSGIYDLLGKSVGRLINEQSAYTLSAGETVEVVLTWNTKQLKPGEYNLAVNAIRPGSSSTRRPEGDVLERATGTLTILPGKGILGTIQVTPEVMIPELATPVNITAYVRNNGNATLANERVGVSVVHEGNTVYSNTGTINLNPNVFVQIDFGSFMPSDSGTYIVQLSPESEDIISLIEDAELFVGTHARGEFTITPDEAPVGDVRVRGRIHIDSAVSHAGSAGSGGDASLMPVIKDAIQKGIDYQQEQVYAWHMNYDCNGCHVQSQAVVALEHSRDIVEVDDRIAELLATSFYFWTEDNGYVNGWSQKANERCNELTAFGLWAIASVKDTKQSEPFLIQAADYLLGVQRMNGSWRSECPDDYVYEGDLALTSLVTWGVERAYEVTGEERYLESLERTASYFISESDNLVSYDNNLLRAQRLRGVAMIYGLINDNSMKSVMEAMIVNDVQALSVSMNADGGWSRNDNYVISDPLVTSQVLYALLEAKVSPGEAYIGNAIRYLLNTQDTDGAWTGTNSLYDRSKYATTTWVVIALPYLYEKMSGLDIDVRLTLPENIALSSATPSPTQAGNTYSWHLSGVGDAGKDIKLDLAALGLGVGEARKVAESADILFDDERTGMQASVSLEIPMIRGISPVSIDISTDKAEYSAVEDLEATVVTENLSTGVKNSVIDVVIKDEAGHEVAYIAQASIEGLEAVGLKGWNYRIPASITASAPEGNVLVRTSIDFNDVFDSLEIANATPDENSIRVLEYDLDGNILGQKEFNATFATDSTVVPVTWLADGTTSRGQTRHFYIYFDLMENGPKPAPEYAEFESAEHLVYMYDRDGRHFLLKSNGDGAFKVSRRLSPMVDVYNNGDLHPDATRLLMSDFNGDGYQDYIGSSVWGRLYYYQNVADGTNGLHPGRYIWGLPTSNYVAGDVNNDGILDLATIFRVGWPAYSYLRLALGNGNGTFTHSQTIPIGEYFLVDRMQLVDVDYDNNLDVVFSVTYGGLSIYKGNGDGTFNEKPKNKGLFSRDSSAILVDLNNDQKLDLLLITPRGSAFQTIDENLNVVSSVWLDNIKYLSSFNPEVRDFNNDGNPDLLAALNRGVYFYAGKGDGTFEDGEMMFDLKYVQMQATPDSRVLFANTMMAEPVPVFEQTIVWNVDTTYAGKYTVMAYVTDSDGYTDEDSVSFDILPEISLDSSVATDRISYNANDTVAIEWSVSSLGRNYMLDDMTASVAVLDVNGATLFIENTPIAALMPGQVIQGKTYWDVGISPAGSYTVSLEVSDDIGAVLASSSISIGSGASGGVLASSEATFEIVSSLETGGGLSGTLTASPDVIRKGQDETLSFSVRNNGNADISELSVEVLVLNPETQELIANESSAFELPRNTDIISSFSVSTSSMAAGQYLAILRAATPEMAEPKALGSDTFEVEAPTVEASKSIGAPTGNRNALVWINYLKKDKKPYPDLQVIDSAIREAGLNATFVYDKKDFQAELRSPFYTDYVILGDHHPIEGHFSDELREKVRRGSGLVSSLFNRHNLDISVFGIKVHGSLSKEGYPLELTDSPISSTASIITTGKVLKIDAFDPAAVIGMVVDEKTTGKKKANNNKNNGNNGNNGGNGNAGNTKANMYPAGVTGSYGIGNTVFFAVDVGLGASMDTAYVQMLTDALSYAHVERPAQSGYYPYAFVPVELTIKSLGDAIDVRVSEWYPDGFKLYSPITGVWVEENPWAYDISLGAEETRVIPFYALTPDIAGIHTLRSEIGYLEGGEYSHIQDVEVALSVEDTQVLANRAEEAIRELQVAPEEYAHVDDALTHLASALARHKDTEEGIHESINDVIQAINSLLDIMSADVTVAVQELDSLLMTYESMWFFYQEPSL